MGFTEAFSNMFILYFLVSLQNIASMKIMELRGPLLPLPTPCHPFPQKANQTSHEALLCLRYTLESAFPSIHPPPFCKEKKIPENALVPIFKTGLAKHLLASPCAVGTFDTCVWTKWELTVLRHWKGSATKDSCNYLLSEFILSALHGANIFRNPEDEKLSDKKTPCYLEQIGHSSIFGGMRYDSQDYQWSQATGWSII